MVYKYLSFSISIAFISWIVGMALNAALRKTAFYNNNLQHLNFLQNENLNTAIGLSIFKWIVKNTFFKFFNQKLKLNRKIEKADLILLREEMTRSEIDHLIGFIFVTIFAVGKAINTDYRFGMIIMIVNLLMNLYPSLLQQQNKRRIDKFLKKISKKTFAPTRFARSERTI